MNSAHHHAQVGGGDSNRDGSRIHHLQDRVSDLLGDALLDLHASRKVIDDARDFRKPQYLSVRVVSDARLSPKRKEMVLA